MLKWPALVHLQKETEMINFNFEIYIDFVFFILGVPLDQLEPSVFAKARTGKGRDNAQKQKDIAAIEAQIYHLTEILGVSRNFIGS